MLIRKDGNRIKFYERPRQHILRGGPVATETTFVPTSLSSANPFKGTVSLDIAFYFRVYKLKSVLSVRPIMAYKFVYFVVLQIYKHTF
jgi:hypothetical protein